MPELYDIIKTYGAIPPLASFKRPLFIGPHPDDIEFGCGGLIAKLKDAGIPFTYLIATDGAAGSDDPSLSPKDVEKTRKEESLKAAAFLGAEEVCFAGLEDGGDYDVDKAIKALIPFVLQAQPDIIFAPDPLLKTECHPDHLKIGEAVRRLVKLVSYRESLRRHGIDVKEDSPLPHNITLAFYFSDDTNVKEEITPEQFQRKIAALQCHASQMKDPSTELLLNYFYLKAQELGKGTSTGLTEDYRVLLPLLQHCYTEGIHY